MNLHDEIAEVAYALFESRCCLHGYDLDDWLQAERIVFAQHAGHEMEEPEEEGEPGEFASVGAGVMKAPGKKADESEELYINEEMS
jgi:hypothetical protein